MNFDGGSQDHLAGGGSPFVIGFKGKVRWLLVSASSIVFSCDWGVALQPALLTSSAQLCPDYATQRFLERLAAAIHNVSERLIDQALVIAAAGFVYLVTEPVQDLGVEADSDPDLASGERHDGAARASAEVVFFLHKRVATADAAAKHSNHSVSKSSRICSNSFPTAIGAITSFSRLRHSKIRRCANARR